MNRQIVLDTETTGLSTEQGHRIIEIGCLELVKRRITGNTFHRYINPDREIERGAEQVHGISTAFLADKPFFVSIVKEFMQFVEGAELIIHNAPFDVAFINYELSLLRKGYSPITEYCGVIDTLTIARQKHPGQHNSLDALCRRYSVDNSNRNLHGALLDAELLAQVYLLMTGGQTQMFAGEEEQVITKNNSQHQRMSDKRQPLPIITASDEELQAHNKFLALLRERGNCLWD